MKVLRTAGLGILYFIGTIILVVAVALGTLWGYFSLQLLMFGKEDYMLFVAGNLNMVPAIMIMVLIIFAIIGIKEKIFNSKEKQVEITDESDKPLNIEELSKLEKLLFKLLNALIARNEKIVKIFRAVKISYILVLIVFFYLGMTSYAILYPESIKVSSPIVPKGVVYKYSDIKNVNVGISRGYKNSYSPYYKVVFNDGKSVDFFGATMQESKDISFEYILIDLDKKLRTQGVVKNVDKEDFEKYSKGLDMDFVSRVEKLFDDK